jgi:hypothetical protein
VPLTFVVSTGRCGSTMLTLILREHPQVLSLSEFFTWLKASQRSSHIPDWEMDGREFWQLLATPLPAGDDLPWQLRQGSSPRYGPGTGRFSPAAGVPVISRTVLPTLTDDPDALFDRLAAEAGGWPTRPAAGHYQALFDLLARLLDRPVVVERSGGSLPMVPMLHEMFPEARFVHLYRDGPDCALSMSRRPAARRAVLYAEAARAAGLPPGATFQQIQAALTGPYKELLTPPFDKRRIMEHPIALTAFGDRWSAMVTTGVAALRRLPPAAWASLRYEELLHAPATELTRLAEFLGVWIVPGWLATTQRLVDPARAGRASTLPAADRAALQRACQPGTAALRAAETVHAGQAAGVAGPP